MPGPYQNGVPLPEAERSMWVSNQIGTFRDLVWCCSINEPAFLEYRDGDAERICSLCKCSYENESGAGPYHVFLGHVIKPY
jgi:hypothetical protein